MFEFLFDLPLLVTGPALLAALGLFAIGGISALDRPFRGDLGIGPEPFQLIRDQLMTPGR